jgi:hypothetical protein
MALYTRIWAGGKQSRQTPAQEQVSLLTIQAALEVIQTTNTPTRTEIKLAYSLWEEEVLNKSAAKRSDLSRHARA